MKDGREERLDSQAPTPSRFAILGGFGRRESLGRAIPWVVLVFATFGVASAVRGDLVAHWPFDQDLLDESGRENHGKGFGTLTYVSGPHGLAVVLDEIGRSAPPAPPPPEYVEPMTSSGIPVYNVPAYSVALWVLGEPQSDRRVYSEGSRSDRLPLFTLGTDVTDDTGALAVFIRNADGDGPGHMRSESVVFDGRWHHVAWVDVDGDAALYVDGVRDRTDFSYEKQPLPLDRVGIGAVLRDSDCCHFLGRIDDVRIYDHALSDAEIRSLAGLSSQPSWAYSVAGVDTDVTVSGEYSATVDCVLSEMGLAPEQEGPQGWAFSLEIEGALAVSTTAQGTAAATTDDSPPGFRNPTVGFYTAELAMCSGDVEGDGVVSSVVLGFLTGETLPVNSSHTVLKVGIQGEFPAEGTSTVRLEYRNGCVGGGQPVENTVIHAGQTVLPSLGSLEIRLHHGEGRPRFLRGDCNDDGTVDISDARFLLNFLFLGGPGPSCEVGGDLNDDGTVNIADVQYVLNYLFLGAAAPTAPYPDCGTQVGEEALGCESSTCT